jgi:hypothetical protein
MRIVVYHSKFYDWEPVPSDVKVTAADLASGKAKPMARGEGYLMKVTKTPAPGPAGKPGETYTEIALSEAQIIAKIIHDKCRPEGGRTLSRKQAVAMYLSEHTMPHHAERAWLNRVEVLDDGPNEALLREMLAPHIASGTHMEPDEVDAFVAAYMEKADAMDHVKHLHAHFRIDKAKKSSGGSK